MKRLLVIAVFPLLLIGCASTLCAPNDSNEACAAKKQEAWRQTFNRMAMTDDTIAAGGGDRYGQCQRRAEVESRKERVVRQECETTKSADGLSEKSVCRNVVDTEKDLDIYEVVLRDCLNDIRRDARDARRTEAAAEKSIIKPIDCKTFPNAAGCY